MARFYLSDKDPFREDLAMIEFDVEGSIRDYNDKPKLNFFGHMRAYSAHLIEKGVIEGKDDVWGEIGINEFSSCWFMYPQPGEVFLYPSPGKNRYVPLARSITWQLYPVK